MLPEQYKDQYDVALMAATAGGDLTAFDHLVRRHQGRLSNFFVRMGVTQVDADDLLQETFLKIFRACKGYKPDAQFTTFLHTVARNTFIDRVRRSHRYQELIEGYTGETGAKVAPPAVGAGGVRLDVAALLAQLSPKLREVVVLVAIQGLQYDEAAAVLAIPLGTVKSRLNQAMLDLRKLKT